MKEYRVKLGLFAEKLLAKANEFFVKADQHLGVAYTKFMGLDEYARVFSVLAIGFASILFFGDITSILILLIVGIWLYFYKDKAKG